MASLTDRLSTSTERVDRLLTDTTTGPRGHTRRVTILELALEHADAWAAVDLPRDGERGGTTTPGDHEERLEQNRVIGLATRALTQIPDLVAQIDHLTRELYDTVQRLAATVDATKLPDPPKPGCASCARTEQRGPIRIGGHYAPVYDRTPNVGLCAWCYRYDLSEGHWPPVEAVELYHRQSARAAGLYLAKLISTSNGRGMV